MCYFCWVHGAQFSIICLVFLVKLSTDLIVIIIVINASSILVISLICISSVWRITIPLHNLRIYYVTVTLLTSATVLPSIIETFLICGFFLGNRAAIYSQPTHDENSLITICMPKVRILYISENSTL